jgi:hypothetical protein
MMNTNQGMITMINWAMTGNMVLVMAVLLALIFIGYDA